MVLAFNRSISTEVQKKGGDLQRFAKIMTPGSDRGGERKREKSSESGPGRRESVLFRRASPTLRDANSIDACPKKKTCAARVIGPKTLDFFLSFFPSFSPSVITFANRCKICNQL
jgi:hypothetical protein